MKMNWEIYTLTDPRTLRARYVGVTTNPRKRYRSHCCEAKRGGRHSRNWITSLERLGLKPIYLTLEKGEGDAWGERERFWISIHRKCCDLTNLTDGGEGTRGYRPTEQTRQRMSEAQRRRFACPIERHKVSVANRGRKRAPLTEEMKERISKTLTGRVGWKHTDESKRKISVANRGHVVSEETRRKIGDVNRGKVFDQAWRDKLREGQLRRYAEQRKQLGEYALWDTNVVQRKEV